MTIEAYPLHWPMGWQRIEHNADRDAAMFHVKLAKARDDMLAEVQRLVGKYTDPMTIISSNVALRLDGLPYANQPAPEDPGVAVYFTYRKSQRVFACDRYKKVEHNIRAIGKTIEAMRGIERWGASDMLDRAFQGFEALPDLSGGSWRSVLRVTPDASLEFAEKMYRRLRSKYHPDNQETGDPAQFQRVQDAFKQAKEELG